MAADFSSRSRYAATACSSAAVVASDNGAVASAFIEKRVGDRIGLHIEVVVTDGSEPVGRGIGPYAAYRPPVLLILPVILLLVSLILYFLILQLPVEDRVEVYGFGEILRFGLNQGIELLDGCGQAVTHFH